MTGLLTAPGLPAAATGDLRPVRLRLTDQRWHDFATTHPEATIFHHPAWATMVARCYGYRPFALALRDQVGTIVAGLPLIEAPRLPVGRRWVSLPFTDYCPPLGATGSGGGADAIGRLLDALRRDGGPDVEIRAELPAGRGRYPGDVAVRHLTAVRSGPGTVPADISKMHRRNVRKAEQAGVRVRLGTGPRDIETFYRLHLLTRQRLGVPVQPRRFFDLLGRDLIGKGLGFVLTADLDDTPVATAIFLHWNGTLIYKYGASDAQHWQSRPNNLLFWTALQWAAANGYHTFDWGRSDLEDSGLREFKRGWGATEVPLQYTVLADRPPHPSTGRLGQALTTVIQRSPPWVCRLLGEVLYRYAA